MLPQPRLVREEFLQSMTRMDDGAVVSVAEVIADLLQSLAGQFSSEEHRALPRQQQSLYPGPRAELGERNLKVPSDGFRDLAEGQLRHLNF